MKQVAMASRSGGKCLDFLLVVLRTVSSAGMANAGLQQRLLDCAQTQAFTKGCWIAPNHTGGRHERSKEGYWRASMDTIDTCSHNAGAEDTKITMAKSVLD